ncbi:hypothetical protein [Oceanicoccus sagamiensis]|uniref:PNPLA domain-containing protein n=1 Tax=Oceanicoccus sagamiensis TaxID=716816 RepID=A0A1X9NH63_9GAMM|nr:hypothetical protein [Oceanicoccus sagamiensis]ARN75185.1 hypothetical protein BST96_14300 [Oceanicoccus sagamiensis]
MVLTIQAGAKAYQQIRNNGLSAEDISAVFGASGAAKWITIYGLDRAIFSDWLPQSTHPIDLFGTSVGAFKLAAAAQRDPAEALLRLVDAYISQNYENNETAEQVVKETQKLLHTLLPPSGIEEILHNPRLRYHCGSVKCLGGLASREVTPQKIAMVKGFFKALAGRKYLGSSMERVVFHAGSSPTMKAGCDKFTSSSVALNSQNIMAAISSSGSIPVMMEGIEHIEGAANGMYRDGGLLDYHPVPSNLAEYDQGLVLYPHFYSYLKESWFDKFFPWRTVPANRLDNVVLISPSEQFVNSLPDGRIPERQDFSRFRGNHAERIRRWNEVKQRSLELGEHFIKLVASGDIASEVQLLSR